VPAGTRTGPGTLSYTIAANPTGAVRNASPLVATRPVSMSQAGATAPVAPGNVRVLGPASGGQ
jgi:hypothetical protein